MRRRLTGARAPHACREKQAEQNVSPDPLVDALNDSAVKAGLGERTDEAEEDTNGEELLTLLSARANIRSCRTTHLAQAEQVRPKSGQRPVEQDISPASYGVFRGKLPGLETRVVLEIVQRLEEVEHCG